MNIYPTWMAAGVSEQIIVEGISGTVGGGISASVDDGSFSVSIDIGDVEVDVDMDE